MKASQESKPSKQVYHHAHNELARLDSIFQERDIEVMDKHRGTKYEVIDVVPIGLIIRVDEDTTRVITYEGQENLQSDRYSLILHE